MSTPKTTDAKHERVPSLEDVQTKIRNHCEVIIQRCLLRQPHETFFLFEPQLHVLLAELGCLFFQLFLLAAHFQQEESGGTEHGRYYLQPKPVGRTLKTIYGNVRYWRRYAVNTGDSGGGFYPVDVALGLARDGFSPFVMKIATKFATRMSFTTSVLVFRSCYGWAPSTDTIEQWVLGIGREASAYMEEMAAPEGDGEILVIEVDGKATPTATVAELAKRRGPRHAKKGPKSCCKRHRGKAKRQSRTRTRRKKGDRRKNGRSTTIVVMYTLQRGADGSLHGPVNKTVWASYAPRKVMLNWARRQATKRGFPPDSTKRIHIALDGEKCLHDRLAILFPHASFALDIRHVEEYVWKVGRALYPENEPGNTKSRGRASSNESHDTTANADKDERTELERWVDEARDLLYAGHAPDLLLELKALKQKLSARAKRDASKREILDTVIQYLEPRMSMMRYHTYIEEDLPIATGIVEGAARYVVGERLDCAGMRWIPERAEALLHLRCIELNGAWNQFFDWVYARWLTRLQQYEPVLVRTRKPIDLSAVSQEYETQDASNAA